MSTVIFDIGEQQPASQWLLMSGSTFTIDSGGLSGGAWRVVEELQRKEPTT